MLRTNLLKFNDNKLLFLEILKTIYRELLRKTFKNIIALSLCWSLYFPALPLDLLNSGHVQAP